MDAFDVFHDRPVDHALDGVVALLDAGIEEVEVWLEWFPEAGVDGRRLLRRLRDLRARATELR